MQFVYTEEEHRKVQGKLNLVSIYAEELKRLTNIKDNNTFIEYAQRLIKDRRDRNRRDYR